ncbi:MAG: M20/M25/M40 family metallo-hydrolase [Acidobacteriota bacterium]
MKFSKVLIYISLFLIVTGSVNAGQYISHKIDAEIFPVSKTIVVSDTIKFPAIKNNKVHFLLHGNMNIVSVSDNVEVKELSGEIKSSFFGINTAEFKISDKIPVKHYELLFKHGSAKEFKVKYSGQIYHEIKQIGAEYARGFSETPGLISEKGVYLAGSTFWVPWFNDNLVTFSLKVKSPEKWSTVSQGKLINDIEENGKNISEWNSPEPMDEIYLISAEFYKYKIKQGKVNLYAYMRSAEDNLAMKYLNTTGQYLEMYNKLIGPFPYSKFALIENFWETGYGMPSFTLLGSKVIRFPFILHSSYPHELLHNWWGNSVFVNYKKGNWCEGITVYLADHLIKEQRKQGHEYRRATLQGYTDYVNDENEFPPSEFKARYNASSSAIGYGKVMMVFNMLRQQFGDDVFIRSIQDFYKKNIFKRAEFSDFRRSFEAISGKDLSEFFNQWIYKKGAPNIKIGNASVINKGKMFELKFEIIQTQSGTPYKLRLPAIVYLEGERDVKAFNFDMTKKSQSYEYTFNKKPLRIDIDPFFDVFRRLSDEEIPPSLSKVFGSKEVLIILSGDDKSGIHGSYKKLADNWASKKREIISIIDEKDIKELPSDKDVWLFGWNNKFRPVVENEIKGYSSSITEDKTLIGKKNIDSRKNSIILAVKNPANRSKVVVFLSADNNKALSGLGRKLPHYGKYSYLAFSGEEPSVNLKGQWESENSPLIRIFKRGLSFGHRLPVREPLGKLASLFSSSDMKKSIDILSDKKLEGRGLGTEGLDTSADFIAEKFKEFGLKPGSENGEYFQKWKVKSGSEGKLITLKNVIGLIPGKKEKFAGQAVVIGAHYDHLGRGWPDVRKGNEGKIHPGADDNASGVAVMLELAKNLGKSLSPDRNILFIAFTGEENKLMGSEYFVNNYKKFPVNKIIGVINLDTVGRLNGKKPMIIGSNSAKEWKFMFMGIGYTTGIESDLITQDLDASDQVSFIKKGIPGIQIFSGPHLDYHKPSDTPDKIDPDGLVKIAKISREVLLYLSERELPMTFTGKTGVNLSKPSVNPKKNTRASIGIMPDFTYSSGGVKVGMAMRSAIGKDHVLMKGDIVTAIGDNKVSNLKEYSAALKKYTPGQKVEITFLRSGKEVKKTITMRAR